MTANKLHRLPSGGIWLLTMIVSLLAPTVALGQCDVPLIAQTASVPPNVMILMDSSGSMNTIMWHEEFDNSIAWTGNFNRWTEYAVGADSLFAPSSFNAAWPATPKVRLIPGLHGQNSRYLGNYLNWLFFNATDDQRNSAPAVTRQMVANTAVKAIMNQAVGLRYGLMMFEGDTGGRILANCGSPIADLEVQVDGMVASGWTPTAEALFDAMEYFQDTAGPIEFECQKSFVIVVTDGIPKHDLNIPAWIGDQDGDGNEPGTCTSIGFPQEPAGDNCSDYLDDVAYYMAHNDMRGDLDGKQEINTYTIGFGIYAQLLEDTAVNGKGLFRLAWNLDTLVAQLGTVLGDIVNRISSGAAVAVVSTESSSDVHLFRGKFLPGRWQGFLEAFRLPYSDGQSPEWEAGVNLKVRSPHDRDLFTQVGQSKVFWSESNNDQLDEFLLADVTNGDLVAGSSADDGLDDLQKSDLVIEFVKGVDVPDMRDRSGWKLGDLVYSTPVVVGPPAQFILEPGYQAYLQAYQNRQHVVYVGANDGMLHAFRASDGKELWGFVPGGILNKLPRLLDPDYCHTSLVDLSPRAFDVQLGGLWRTIIVGGQRTGGDTYFAIDVTNPVSPEFLWETSMPQLTSSFTEPSAIRTQLGDVLWTGSGPNYGGDAWCSGLWAQNGNVAFDVLLSSQAGVNMAGSAVPYDKDFDGFHDFIYQGDLAGNLWRYDLRTTPWTYQKIFQSPQPIQGRPTLSVDVDGNVLIYFGTGRYLDASDIGTTNTQYFVAVKDDFSNSLLSMSDLVDQSGTVSETQGSSGWYFALENGSGERVVEPAAIVEGVVYFTSFKPSVEPCSSGGYSFLYSVNFLNGDVVDQDDDGQTSDESRSEALGSGVASRPVVDLSGGDLIVQTSDARLTIQELAIQPQRVVVRSWRERYDAATAAAQEE